MAVTIQAPLAAQLFSLGGAADVGGATQQFKGREESRPRGFDAGEIQQHQGGKESGDGRAAAIANMAGAAASAYMGSQSGATPPDAAGNGFGLGGNLVSGTVDNQQLAGTQKAQAASLFSSPEAPVPVSNGYQDPNPMALQYQGGQASLFNYGGSYGGASY